MKVYAVTEICDYEYGHVEIYHIFKSKESAQKYIDAQEDKDDLIRLSCDVFTLVPRYDIEEYEIEE